jgi:hypothetical protein
MEIERGVKKGLSAKAIAKNLRDEISADCGRPPSMPDYVSGSGASSDSSAT